MFLLWSPAMADGVLKAVPFLKEVEPAAGAETVVDVASASFAYAEVASSAFAAATGPAVAAG